MVSIVRSLLWELICTTGVFFSPLLFMLVLKALSRECISKLSWELLYADDLVLIADTLDDMCVSPRSRHGRLAWKVNGSVSTWRRSRSWSPVLAQELRQLPLMLSAAHSARDGFTRSAATPLIDLVCRMCRARLGLSTEDQCLRWMLTKPCLMWRPLSSTWMTRGLWQFHYRLMLWGLGNVHETPAHLHHQVLLA